jgi:hypothetical protein
LPGNIPIVTICADHWRILIVFWDARPSWWPLGRSDLTFPLEPAAESFFRRAEGLTWPARAKPAVAGGWGGSVCSAVCGICMNPIALGLTYSLGGVLPLYAVNVYNIRMDYVGKQFCFWMASSIPPRPRRGPRAIWRADVCQCRYPQTNLCPSLGRKFGCCGEPLRRQTKVIPR